MKLVGVNQSEPLPIHLGGVHTALKSFNYSDLETSRCLATGLLRRAPSHYLEEASSESLAELVVQAEKYLKELQTSKENIIIKNYTRTGASDSTGILIVMWDRPFIIDTIEEFVETNERKSHCFIHALLEDNDKKLISVSYVECDSLPENEEDKFRNGLEELLEQVVIVTEDYHSMKQCISHEITQGNLENAAPETKRFLEWLLDDGFVFLGAKTTAHGKSDNSLGMLKISNQVLESAITQDIEFLDSTDEVVFCSKAPTRSTVHRQEYMDLITIKSTEGKFITALGLFTSRTRNQEVLGIPAVGLKVREVLINEGLVPNSHDYKDLVSLADTIPKSDLLHFTPKEITSYVHTIIDARSDLRTKLLHICDRINRFHFFVTILPREQYSEASTRTIEDIISKSLNVDSDHIHSYSVLSDHSLVLIRSMVPTAQCSIESLDPIALSNTIAEATQSWEEELNINLSDSFDEGTATRLFNYYASAFPPSYKANHAPLEAVKDIRKVEDLSADNTLSLSIEPTDSYDYENLCRLRIYRRGEYLALSDIIPYLENTGLFVVSETVFPIATPGSVWATIYDIYVTPKLPEPLNFKIANSTLLPALKRILQRELSNDKLNYLLVNPGLSTKGIAALRSLVRYVVQGRIATTRVTSIDTLIKHPTIAKLLLNLFETKFDPQIDSTQTRETAIAKIKDSLIEELRNIHELSRDRIIRSLIKLVDATVRTNYYINEDSHTIVLKIDCSKLSKLPNPKPYREIFVSGTNLQGTHLRGGPVARGGIRWSSRVDDFRTEVLGLMKTQMTKNSIIVPVGAKGGFIVPQLPSDPKEIKAAVEKAYRLFISSLLSITDNRISGNIIPPKNCVRYDGDDPYLVVAADRGTATFSDLANSIATDNYDFWLGDAFASGGSSGYDHKELGITAKGAWECVLRHFKEIGIDISKRDFTVVGIGDMSGDVFGNGLLRSDKAKLVAAFDHRDIFIDPNPDPEASFSERQRMYNLPSSSWQDYNKDLLSDGGCIVSRFDKEITLSSQARSVLGTQVQKCSGEELIQIILKAPVDLLWNGGIGTYIKASTESDSDVPDSTNAEVRISANEVRARIIGEGGNLGVTQLGRIEFSKLGGRINTDAVDNSGGVDMSDLEVNLKLLFREAILSGKISTSERDAILKECENAACDQVLSRNQSQSLVLSLEVKRSRTNLEFYQDVIRFLQKNRQLDRAGENLPNEEEFKKRKLAKAGLTRPELSIVIAQAKMWVFNLVLESDLHKESFLQPLLHEYFPVIVRERFKELISEHPLKKEIIATQISNIIVERMGSPFVLRLSEELNADPLEVIRAFLLADTVIGVGKILDALRHIDSVRTARFYIATLLRLQASLDTTARWFLESVVRSESFDSLTHTYSDGFHTLVKHCDQILIASELNRFKDGVSELISHEVPEDIASLLVASQYAPVFLDITLTAEQTHSSSLAVGTLYATLAKELEISHLVNRTTNIQSQDKWDTLASGALATKMRKGMTKLCKRIIQDAGLEEKKILEYFELRRDALDRYKSTASELRKSEVSIASLFVITNLLETLSD